MAKNNFIKNPNINLVYYSSIVISCLVLFTSFVGILYNSTIYSPSQQVGNLATDWTTLLIVFPVLLISMWLASRGHLLGFLFWPGALFYLVFVYLFYSIAVPFSWVFLLYVTLTALSGYTIIGIIGTIDAEKVKKNYIQQIPSKLVGGLLVFFGIGFLMLDLLDILEALNQTSTIELDTYVPWIVDFTVGIPILLISGVLMWQKKPLGYVLSPGLLIYSVLLDIGVTILYVFKWYYQEPDFEIDALITFFIVTVITLIPLYYYLKKPVAKEEI
ncbi:MAG: hypothetical protein ACW98A_14605 [Candidatus Hodarchaeales archaeon]